MKILILGGAGFIGTNLALSLSKGDNNQITIIDRDCGCFGHIEKLNIANICCKPFDIIAKHDYDGLFNGVDVVYHLISTTIPSTSNNQIIEEFQDNVLTTISVLDSCVRSKVKQFVFLSSGGTVYGKDAECPIKEDDMTNPISSYGIQKLFIAETIVGGSQLLI